MKGQKQSRVDNLEKRMAAVTNVLQQLINELNNLKTMVFGQQEILKQFDEYEKAIEVLKEKATTELSEAKKAESNRKDS